MEEVVFSAKLFSSSCKLAHLLFFGFLFVPVSSPACNSLNKNTVKFWHPVNEEDMKWVLASENCINFIRCIKKYIIFKLTEKLFFFKDEMAGDTWNIHALSKKHKWNLELLHWFSSKRSVPILYFRKN